MVSGSVNARMRSSDAVRLSRVLGMLGVLVCAISVPALVAVDGWLENRRMREAWTISGPACPVAEIAVDDMPNFRPPKSFTYAGIEFTRRFGHAYCVSIPAPRGANDEFARVCQFSAPSAVTIRTPTESITFRPGAARRTTIKVVDGRADCVVAGWFRG